MEFISRADTVIVGAEAILCDLADRLANPNPACQRREIAGLRAAWSKVFGSNDDADGLRHAVGIVHRRQLVIPISTSVH